VAIPTLFGTNKLSSIAGTSAALWRYARACPSLGRGGAGGTGGPLGAWGGAAVVAWLPRDAMRPWCWS
jgi:uncharacterized membrane protein YfcA